MKIVANMVIKNEGDRYLEDVLGHLHNFVDLIVVTDDASTDDSAEMALDNGC